MSEVLPGNRPSVGPVPWRTVNPSVLGKRAGQNAEEEFQRRIEQARREGHEEGLRFGGSDAQRMLPSTLEYVSLALAELERLRQRVRADASQELVRLAIAVAARVVHREMVVNPAAIAPLVRAAVLKLQSRELSRVRMHPSLESSVSKTLEECGAPRNLVLIADSSLSPGDLLFETSQGVLDASLATQFRELERGLMDRLSGAGASPM